jgi:2,5-dihydroxypyridine 5,6-dioxygenase
VDTSPYRIVDLLPSARNMMDYCQVERGEDVAIFADTLIPPIIVQAVMAAVEERGGRPTIVTTQPGGLSWRTGGEPTRTYKTAMYGSDVVIQLKSVEAQTFPRVQETAMIEHDVRMLRVPLGTSVEALTEEWALFPFEVMHLVTRKIYEQWTRGATTPGDVRKTIHVQADNGTDLTATYDPRYVIHTGFLLPKLMPGMWNQFAGATVGIELFSGAEGTVVFDGLHGEEEYKALPPLGSDVVHPLSEPVRWIFKDRHCTIEGGYEAELIRRLVEAGGEHADILCEIALGVNPKAPLSTMPTRRSGVTHYAVGSTAGRTPTLEDESAPVHTHGHLLSCSLWVDDEPCIVDGRLVAFNDPEVREAAAKYGDPDELFKEAAY